MIYYDLVRSFQEPTTIDVDELTTVIAPTTKIGYISVVGIIVAHVTILVLVAALFFQQTRWSFLENAWSATAKVATNEDAQIVLGASSATTEKEILPWIWHRRSESLGSAQSSPRQASANFVVRVWETVSTLLPDGWSRSDRNSPVWMYRVENGIVVGERVKTA